MTNSDWYAFSSGLICKFNPGTVLADDQCVAKGYKGM